MPSTTRAARAIVFFAAIVLAACAGQKEPAQNLIADIEATVSAAAPEAAKYVPEQLMDVQSKLGALKAAFDKQDYAAVIGAAPAVLSAAQSLATAAAAKKDEVLKALNDEWAGLADSVPGYLWAIENRLEFLTKKSNRKSAAGIDLNAAKTSIANAFSLWSKAQAAFAAGNMTEAVRTAGQVKSMAQAAAVTLKLDLAAAAP